MSISVFGKGSGTAVCLPLLLVALAGPSVGQDAVTLYDGEWGLADSAECLDASGQFSICPALTIGQGQFSGSESLCSMTYHSDLPAFETALVYDLACTGEGENWTRRALFMLDLQGRLILLDDEGAYTYLPTLAPRP